MSYEECYYHIYHVKAVARIPTDVNAFDLYGNTIKLIYATPLFTVTHRTFQLENRNEISCILFFRVSKTWTYNRIFKETNYKDLKFA